jgi:hypothetical protein
MLKERSEKNKFKIKTRKKRLEITLVSQSNSWLMSWDWDNLIKIKTIMNMDPQQTQCSMMK